jgi:hypothetical protein
MEVEVLSNNDWLHEVHKAAIVDSFTTYTVILFINSIHLQAYKGASTSARVKLCLGYYGNPNSKSYVS